jgi:hypothetical protein
MRAAGETRTQKHDEGDVETDADFNFMSELVRRRFLMTQLLGEIEPFICRIVGERRILVVDAVGVSGGDPEFRCGRSIQDLKKRTMFADNWLEEKSDAFQSAYTAASCNMVSLTERLEEAKGDFSRLPNMPNAPVVLVSFLHSTDYEQMVPADFQGKWYTGMCLASAKCTDADFVPRNTSIFYDAVAPQMTKNQDAAVKAGTT